MSEQVEYDDSDWEELEKLDVSQPFQGKVTVLPGGKTESSINGQVAIIYSFSGVGSRAVMLYTIKGDNKVKQPRITKLEKGPDGSYKFHCSDGVLLFEPI